MMKKTSLILLSVVVLLALCAGCSLIPLPGFHQSFSTSIDAIDSTADEAAPILDPQNEPAPQTSAFSPGVWDGDVYRSGFLELTFAKPAGWVAATDEELSIMLGIATDSLDGLDAQTKEIAAANSIYDMMVGDMATGDTILICLENIAALSPIADNVTEVDYFQALKRQFAQLYPMPVSVQSEDTTCQIGGHVYHILHVEVPDVGQQYYVTRKVGDYMASLLITSISGQGLDDFLSLFS